MAITINGSGITSSEIADGTITNADINASAGIVGSKLSGTPPHAGTLRHLVTYSRGQYVPNADIDDNTFWGTFTMPSDLDRIIVEVVSDVHLSVNGAGWHLIVGKIKVNSVAQFTGGGGYNGVYQVSYTSEHFASTLKTASVVVSPNSTVTIGTTIDFHNNSGGRYYPYSQGVCSVYGYKA